MRRSFIAFVCGMMLLFLLGCETVKGMGKDIENTGRNLQNMFKDKQNK
jgi:predicted small secreted protein